MKLTSNKLSNSKGQQLRAQLAELLADIKNPEDMNAFLEQFLTFTELSALSKRLEIIRALAENVPYQQIQQELKVSSATVASSAPFLETAIAQKILYHMSVSQWADTWSKKLTRILGR